MGKQANIIENCFKCLQINLNSYISKHIACFLYKYTKHFNENWTFTKNYLICV